MWNNDNGGYATFLGLGYHHHHKGTSASASPLAEASATPQDSVQALMQQCLVYHEEQEAIRQQQQHVHGKGQNKGHDAAVDENSMHFVRSVELSNEGTKVEDMVLNVITKNAQVTMTREATDNQQQLIEEARERAQVILARFQQQQQQLLFRNSVVATSSSENARLGWESAGVLPAVFAEQRRVGLQREDERKHRALLRNLEYLAAKESQRILQLNAQVEESAVREKLANQQYQANLVQRKERMLSAGRTPPVSNRKQNDCGGSQTQHSQPECGSSLAIYVSGLPVASVDEEYIRQLFGCYGAICKVHFYRDKQSNRLKGDGLVVFRLEDTTQINDLLQIVCGQVSESNRARLTILLLCTRFVQFYAPLLHECLTISNVGRRGECIDERCGTTLRQYSSGGTCRCDVSKTAADNAAFKTVCSNI